MKKGISLSSFSDWNYDVAFKQAKEYGFDGVELFLMEAGEGLTLSSTKDEMLEIRKKIDDAGLEPYSITTGLCWQYSLTSDDEAERAKAEDVIKKQLEAAAVIGCETILVVPGASGVDFAPHLGVVDYEVAFNRALEGVKKMSKVAEDCGVVIGIENVWNKILLTPLEMRTFIDEVGSEFVGAYFDVGNVLINSYPEHWIRILGDRIKKVHFKDFKRSINNNCDLLAGDVDYSAVMEAFRNIGYDGWATAEMFPYPKHNEVMLAHTSLAMDTIFKN